MKFSEKLQKLRKENKMSQESLADLMDVSRQSVSKWESGQAYPEMDKLLALCKIFKCSLDDLTNDEISEINIDNKEKVTPSNLVDQFLNIIKQVYNKVTSMNSKDVVKMIIEIFIILLIIFMLSIPYNILTSEICGIIYNPEIRFLCFISSVLNIIFKTIYLIIGTIIFAYIFKLRYLEDAPEIETIKKAETKSKNEKQSNEIKEDQPKEVKIVKQNSHNIIDFLAAIAIGFIKFLIGCICISFMCTVLGLAIALTILIILAIKDVVFIGAILSLIGTMIIFILLSKVGLNFVFNNKTNITSLFIFGTLSLLLIGSGIAVSTYEISEYTFINELSPLIEKELVTKEITYKDNLYILDYWYGNIIYVEANEIEDNKIIIEYETTDFANIELREINDYIYFRNKSNINIKKITDDIIEHLKDKKLYNYEYVMEADIIVKANKGIINKLKNNKDEYYENEEIQELKETIKEQDELIADLEEQIEELTN